MIPRALVPLIPEIEAVRQRLGIGHVGFREAHVPAALHPFLEELEAIAATDDAAKGEIGDLLPAAYKRDLARRLAPFQDIEREWWAQTRGSREGSRERAGYAAVLEMIDAI